MGSTEYDPNHHTYPLANVMDGDYQTTAIAGGHGNAWMSIKLRHPDQLLGYVYVYNRVDEEYQYLLGEFEVWTGDSFGDLTSMNARFCGRTTATEHGQGPYSFWCGGTSTERRRGSYITIRQVGAGRYLCLGEIVVFGRPPPPSPPAEPPPLVYPDPPAAPAPENPPSPPRLPSSQTPSPPPDIQALSATNLNQAQCNALLADPTSRFHQLWGHEGWAVRHDWDEGCWGGDNVSAAAFFADARSGTTCGRNWYEGNPGPLGRRDGGPTYDWVWPHFTDRRAPALLGFDENIDGWCHTHGGNDHAAGCIREGYNILSLYWPAQYNICRNFEWQLCAAQGLLPGQGGTSMRFAFAPNNLEVRTGFKPLGSCTGYHPRGCGNQGYASSDIFYLEVCIFSTICSNGHELFDLEENQDWTCVMDDHGYARLQGWLMANDENH